MLMAMRWENDLSGILSKNEKTKKQKTTSFLKNLLADNILKLMESSLEMALPMLPTINFY